MSDPDKHTSSNWTPPSVAELQAMLPQYEVTALWGRGGMGAVYKGRQLSLHRDIAIKVLPENFAAGGQDSDPHQFVERFKLEARAMANLDHPAILSVHDFGQTEQGQLYLVMEFVDGMDIHAYLQHHGGKLPDKHAIAICSHVLDALQYAHDSGVIHRDIKPSNVLINSQGRVKLADFGLAKRIATADSEDSGAPLTLPDMAMGTPDFVAPETLDPELNSDGRADLYGVGVMLYQLLTGKLPRGQFKMPSKMMPELDVRFDEVISKALQADPDDRYPSATNFRSDLDKILSQPIPKAADPQSSAIPVAELAEKAGSKSAQASGTIPKPKTAVREKSKAPLFIGIGLAAVLLIGGIVAFLTRGDNSSGELVGRDVPVEPSQAEKTSIGAAEVAGNSTAQQGRFAPPPPPIVDPTITNGVAAEEKPKPEEPTKPEPEPSTEPEPAKPEPTTPAPPSSTPSKLEAPQTPEIEPATAQLAAIPGLKNRLDTYLNARRTAVAELAISFLKGVDGRMNQAADAGNLKLTKAYRSEKAQVEALQKALEEKGTNTVEAVGQSATLPPLAADAPDGLVSLRRIWETEREKIRTDLDGKLQQSLKALESELTRARELEQAEMVLAFREGLGGEPRPAVAAVAEQPKPASPNPASATNTAMASQKATRDKPFVNSLGMRFVPVPITGGQSDGKLILFSIWETRVRDFENFLKDDRDREWNRPSYLSEVDDPEDHPVALVSWEDAVAFCDWLTEEDRKKGLLGPTQKFRLPTDHEWSCAAGIGSEEDPSTPLSQKSGRLKSYPWGDAWPPPVGSGNFFGEEMRNSGVRGGREPIEGFADGYFRTAPVGSFAPNGFGILDLAGNVGEFCENWFDPSKMELGRVYRGLGWGYSKESDLYSSKRSRVMTADKSKSDGVGFRAVLDTGVPAPNATSVTQPPPFPATPQIDSNALKLASKERPFVNSLGMKFVPVPGIEVLFCSHETRFKDYAEFAKENPDVNLSWKDQIHDGFTVTDRPDEHPVVNVNWTDSKAFCEWISRKEGIAYRLPTDKEWSEAVGLGRKEKWNRDDTPATVEKDQNEFPWGAAWPPPKGAGNFSDESRKARAPKDNALFLEGYDDSFPTTAPVMSFAPNEFGLHDLSGNAWEWVEDRFSNDRIERVLRGSSWFGSHGGVRSFLLSSYRHRIVPDLRAISYGFRVVIDPNAEVPTTPQTAAKPANSPAVIQAALEKKPGRLYGFGNLPGGIPVSVATGSKFDDFVSVHVFSGGWIGLRGNGDVVTAQEAKVEGFPRGITKLGNSPYRELQSGIDRNGNLKFATQASSQLLEKEPRNLRGVSDIWTSPPGPNHLVLLDDGTVKYWGAAYDAARATNPPLEALEGVRAIAASANTNQCFVVRNDGSVIGWTPGGGRIEVPESIRDVKELAAGNNCCFALTEAGKILFWGSKGYGVDQVPDGLEECVAIRADRCTAAAQKKDGTWVAWGNSPNGIVEKINSLGPVSDIAFQSSTSPPSPDQPGFVFWIKADVE